MRRRAKRVGVWRAAEKRLEHTALVALRTGLRVLGALSLPLSARWAEALFRTPPRQRKTRSERAVLAAGAVEELKTGGTRVAVWRWGEGPPVLLVHGWGGHAGRLARFVNPLVTKRFSVVAFDAPAHGDSDGVRVSLPDLAAVLLEAGATYGPLAGIVAHSLGAMASMMAMRRGLSMERAVFLAPPANPDRYSRLFGNYYRLPQPVTESMKAFYAARHGVTWDDFFVTQRLGEPRADLLVFHDLRDSLVPISEGRAIVEAWKGARLVPTTGLGHSRILRDPFVVNQAVAFLEGTAPLGISEEELAS